MKAKDIIFNSNFYAGVCAFVYDSYFIAMGCIIFVFYVIVW